MASNPIEIVKEKINSILSKYPVVDTPLSNAAERVKVDKAFLVLGGLIAIPILLYSLFNGGTFVIDLIGFTFPMYASIKAIESENKDDDTVWLTYWLIFSLFKITEGAADFLLQYIPFYLLIKATFLVYCFHPKTQGAKLIYTAAVKPYLVPLMCLEEDADSKKHD